MFSTLRKRIHLFAEVIYFILLHIATLPGMWDHTVTISSAGKTFSATGWKVGIYVYSQMDDLI